MKHKLIIVFFALIASAGTLFAQSGTCGDNLTWTLNNGTLTISGTGSMANYDYYDWDDYSAPWFDYRSFITNVIINSGVQTIGNGAFYYCSSLTSITIPNSVTNIGDGAFENCRSLNAVHVSDIAVWCTIPLAGALVAGYRSDEVWDLHYYNLYLNGNLITDLIIPNNVTNIGQEAFSYCSSLTSVTIPNSVTSIGDRAFCGCRSLTSITISNSVTSIGNGAFSGCTGLTSLTIPNSVTSIGNGAFSGCSSLTSITIPNSVTSIGNGAFSGCWSLTSIRVAQGNIVYDSRNSCNAIIETATNTLIAGCQNTIIPNSVTSIGNYAFYYCSRLTSVTIPNSVTSIGYEAFYGCIGLTSITIPNSVTRIGESAFYDCSGLTFVTIPNSVTSIGEWAFWRCSGLTSVTIPNSVTSIGSSAFSGCTGLTSVTIPNSVTSIGSFAFDYVPNIVYSGTATGTPWGARSLNGYVDGNLVYRDATKTKLLACSAAATGEITIPNSVTSIGEYAFSDCTGLTSLTIPNSVTSIGTNAFSDVPNIIYFGTATGAPWGARSLNGYVEGYLVYRDATKTELLACSSAATGEIAIPNSVTSIGESAFYGCIGLTSITIPNSVTRIGESAFSGCTGLTSVTIPNSVTSIGRYAFWGCISLTSVICYAMNPLGLGYAPFNIFQDAILYVPANAVSAYKANENWKNSFKDILPIDETDLEDIMKDAATPSTSVRKVLQNGQLYILRDGKVYNATGAEVK